uniref:Uncharacterized protein n=1 Tax=Molossus molossus TaxID=27622 RepID=A0A7J8ERG1_MOLMO|nr:hypothetical protein HJG59_008754 [Molossus molossus]
MGKGVQEAGSPPLPFIQLSSPSLPAESCWEKSSSSLPPAGAFQPSILKRSHSALRPPALKRVDLCSGTLPGVLSTACTLHSLKWAQSGWLAQRGAWDEHCASTPSPGQPQVGEEGCLTAIPRARSFPSKQ